MNKIFRIVFNTTTGRWVVASEMAKGRTKSNATRIGASLLGLSGLAVISPSAFAGDFIMCNGLTQDALIARGTDDFLPGLTCTPSSTGIIMSDSADGSLPVASDAYITIGNNYISPTQTVQGALLLNGPNGIRMQGATTTTGLATFQNGANLSNTKITGLASGTLAAGSTDAVNGGQLFTTNQNVAANATDIATLQTSVGLVQQDATTRTVSVAKDTNGTLVDLTGTAGVRKLTGLSAGTLSATSTDAVNGAQLNTTNQNVTALGGRVTTAEGDITNLKSANRYVKVTGKNDGTDDAVSGSGVAIGAGASNVNGTSQYNPTVYQSNVAIGTGATTAGGGAISIGDHATAAFTNIAIGAGADTSGAPRLAVAVGLAAKVTGLTSTAMGYQATAGGNNAIALGDNSVTSANTTVALGSSANASAANSVALGAGSTTTAVLTTAGYNPGSATLSGTASTANGEVSIGKSGSERRLTNLAAGSAATDAVNVSQLQAQDATVDLLGANTAARLGGGAAYTATTGAVTAPSYTLANANAIAGSTGAATDVGSGFTKVDSALGNLGGRVTTAEGNITSLQNSVGLVQQDATSRTISVGSGTNGALVDFTGTAGVRKLTGVSAGTLSATSADAVNGSQLFATNQNVTKNATDITALGGRVTTTEGNITNIGSQLTTTNTNVTNLTNQINNGLVGLVQQDATTRTISVAKGSNGALVDFAGTAGVRKLTGVSAGTLSATSTDAVDGAQLDATNQNVAANATNITALGGRVTTTEGNIANLQTTVNNISSGTAGLVQQDATTRTISVAKGNNGTLVDFAGTAGARKLTGVSAGTLSGTSTDAVNGAQLNATNQNVTALDGRVTTAEGNITNVTNRVTTVEGNVANLTTQINHGSIGLVQQAAAGSKLTVGAGTDGSEVDFANKAGRARKLTRVAAGTGSEDAVNVSQLKSVTDGLGGGASIDPVTGLVTGPTYALTNADGSQSPVHTVGDAVTNLDGRVYGNTSRINSLTSQISTGTVGMVQQAGAGQKLTVGKDTDGSEVSFANAAGTARKLSGVAAGAVSATSTDAVNGSQLHGVSQSVATALGGGASVNADGTISAPTYTVTNADGTTAKVSGVEGAIGNLDGRVHDNTARIGNVESSVSNLSSKIDSGAVGLVQQAAPGEQLTVGKSTDGTSVNVAGTAGDRVLAGVAAGKADNEAVNVGQLKTAGVIGENGEVKAVLGYDSVDKGSITLGGAGATNPVALHNVAAGVSDADAVNVSQLNARLQAQSNSVMAQANAYADDRFKSAINEIDSLRTDVDDRFQVQDKRIDRLGAMSSAMTSMASSMSGVNRVNRVGVGAGDSNGRLAMAVGYQRAFRDSGATLTAGASFTDEDSTVGVGAGFGW